MLRGPIAAAFLIAVSVVVVMPAGSRADEHPRLVEARGAIEAVRYDEARDHLVAALESGANEAGEVAEIHLLLGEVFVALGDSDSAVDHFARALALVPDAELGDMVSPKIRESFDAARTQLDGAAVAAEIDVDRDSRVVTVKVVSDPVQMIVGALVTYRAAEGAEHRLVAPREGEAPIELELDPEVELGISIYAVDEHGNRLAGRYVGDLVSAKPQQPVPAPAVASTQPPAPPADRDTGSLVGRWWLWGGVAGVFVASGAVFGLRASAAQSDLDELRDSSGDHEFAEARSVEDRARTSALLANISYAAALGATVAAVVLFVRGRPGDESGSSVVPTVSPTGAGVSWELRF